MTLKIMGFQDFDSILVTDIMSKALITVNPATTCFQIAKMMERGFIGAVLVSEKNNPVGIITDRDFAIKIATNRLSYDTPAREIMSSPLITVNYDSSVLEAVKTMSIKKIRKIAVSKDNKIIGIVTSTDVVNHLTR
ncbi:cyclic nucleotide-binding/CBS domain-containing protein [Nitrosopumilus sp.]|uniref:cyclic nucleotide-binding/CBS domain-containing protein n=1 Tax=Nitrosopumilus sp. TaxID=2024843 RepID=UPI00349FF083